MTVICAKVAPENDEEIWIVPSQPSQDCDDRAEVDYADNHPPQIARVERDRDREDSAAAKYCERNDIAAQPKARTPESGVDPLPAHGLLLVSLVLHPSRR